jgi:hypothetical protein
MQFFFLIGRFLKNLLSFETPSSFRGEDFKNLANQKQELPVAAMFGNGS